jgi:hypothetical protein
MSMLRSRVASPLLLVIALAACVGCGTPSPSKTPPPAASTPEATRAAAASPPGAQPLSGCKTTTPPQVFGPDNLWESIDGAAETYLAFGFQDLSASSCTTPGGVEVAIEVYRLADALNAFGIYAQERGADAGVQAIGAEGYTSRNVLNFWSGATYVKLRASTDAPGVAATLADLARQIAARFGPPGPLPARLGALPAAGQVPLTIKYVPRDVLGQHYLSNAVEAQYHDGASTCRLVVASLESAEQGADAQARFKAFLATSGRVTQSLSAPGDGGFVATSSLYGPVVVVRAGPVLAVVLGAASDKSALDLIIRALSPKP